MPVAKATASVNPSTRQSSAETADEAWKVSLMRGRLPGARASSARTPHAPIRKPRMPPAKASNTLNYMERKERDRYVEAYTGIEEYKKISLTNALASYNDVVAYFPSHRS